LDLRNQREILIGGEKCADGRICAGGNQYTYIKWSVHITVIILTALHLKVAQKKHKLPLFALVYV
jgi:hypothetical protein